jgi:hypothetical protein
MTCNAENARDVISSGVLCFSLFAGLLLVSWSGLLLAVGCWLFAVAVRVGFCIVIVLSKPLFLVQVQVPLLSKSKKTNHSHFRC